MNFVFSLDSYLEMKSRLLIVGEALIVRIFFVQVRGNVCFKDASCLSNRKFAAMAAILFVSQIICRTNGAGLRCT